MKCTIQNTGAEVTDAEVHMLRNGGVTGFAKSTDTLNTGQNSGFQVLNLAWHAGAALAVLLGYDMQFSGGKSHWHAGHPGPVPEVWYKQMHFRSIGDCGMRIINASRETSLDCFPRMPIEEALA
jgi:hypothetical protein